MFTKFVIFLAVGCTLTLAQSTQQDKSYELLHQQVPNIILQPRSILGNPLGKVGSWIHKTTNAVTSIVTKPIDILIQTGLGFADYGNEKVRQVMQKYHDIKYKYNKNIDEIKNEIIKRALQEAQKIIDIVAKEANVKTCIEMKQSRQQLVDSGREALDKLQHDLEDAVGAELKNLQDELTDWEVEADNVSKDVKKSPRRSSS